MNLSCRHNFVTLVAIGFCSLAMPHSAASATLNVSGGNLLGATGVIVAGNAYDVEFVDGTCVAIFSGCDEASDFVFQNASDALLASYALLESVFVDGPDGLFDSLTYLTSGADDPWLAVGEAYTPFDASPDGSLVRVSSALNSYPDDRVYPEFETSYSNLWDSTSHYQFWAVWKKAADIPLPSAVPIPFAASLLGAAIAALFGLACIGWQKRNPLML